MIVTFSGAACVGKDTMVNYLFWLLPQVNFIPSYTTRKPRSGDRGYIYIDEEEFEDMYSRGMFAWTAGPFGNRYGTRISDLVTIGIKKEIIWISILTPDSVEKLRTWAQKLNLGKILSIYLYCNDEKILRERFSVRGDKDVDTRITECRNWNQIAAQYNFFEWIDNSGDIDFTKRKLARLIRDMGFLDLK